MKTRLKILFVAFSMIPLLANAQKHELGIALGGMNYTGEISQSYNLRTYRQSLYGFYKNNIDPAWGIKISLLEGEFNAADKNSSDPLPLFRNQASSATIVEFATMAEYNFFDYRKAHDQRRKFTPYLAGGLAFAIYSQNTTNKKEVADGTTLAIPFGVGLRYQLSTYLNLGFEFIARKTFSDYLDGISSKRSPRGLELGDPYAKDWYYFTGFTFSYTFYGVKCPRSFL